MARSLKVRVKRIGGAEQHTQVHIIVRATTSAVDQSRFRGKVRLLEQGMHRQVGSYSGPGG